MRADAPRLLIVGCGDVGQRVLDLTRHFRRHHGQLLVLSSRPQGRPEVQALGVGVLRGNLDHPSTLGRLGAWPTHVLHLAPPPGQGVDDPRTRHLLRALARGGTVRRWVYASTTGVYGDCAGALVPETRAVAPATDRARRRVDAESWVRAQARAQGFQAIILRIPGIYALDRAGGDPRERVARGQPVLRQEDDVFTNHIHADDLARACWRALWLPGVQPVVQVCDDDRLPMGDYYERVAQLSGLPTPQRISREEARGILSPMTLSFLSESRRLLNLRMKRQLRLVLRYPSVADALTPPCQERRQGPRLRQ